jgi:hypothetical protein
MPPENTTSPWGLPFPSGVGRVNLGATDFNELATKLNTIFNEKFLVVKTSAVEITAKAGELVEMTAAGTVNLPKAPAANTTIGIFATASPIVVKTTAGEDIYNYFHTEVKTSVKLLLYQYIIVTYDGTRYLVIGGEPANENAQGARTGRAYGTEYEAGAARMTFVKVIAEKIGGAGKLGLEVFVGGVAMGESFIITAKEGDTLDIGMLCPPKVKWKAEQKGGETASLQSSYLTM